MPKNEKLNEMIFFKNKFFPLHLQYILIKKRGNKHQDLSICLSIYISIYIHIYVYI